MLRALRICETCSFNTSISRIFAYVDKAGRPSMAQLFIIAFFPIAYANLADIGWVLLRSCL
jgi:amino acid permease